MSTTEAVSNREHTTILTLMQDDGGEGTYIYVFGHDCKGDVLIDMLKHAIAEWLRSDDGKLYVTENNPCMLDWVDCLGNIPESFLEAVGVNRRDLTWGVDSLASGDELVPEDMVEFYEDLNLNGPGEEVA